MLARNETIFKWVLYAAATVVWLAAQEALFQRCTVWGVIPFVYPLLAAIPATFEGPVPGTAFALGVGVVCDLLLPAPLPCFYTLVFPLAGMLAGGLARRVLSSGFLSALATSSAAFVLTGLFHGLIFALSSRPAWRSVFSVCGRELAVSIPLVLPVFFLFRVVWRKCLDDPARRG